MGICSVCDSVDFLHLLAICLSQCRDRQEAVSSRYEQEALLEDRDFDDQILFYEGSEVKHHGDIFEIEKSSEFCDLCKVIFEAFKRAGTENVEDIRGLPIVFRASSNKIEVCYSIDTKGGLVRVCTLDMYMNESNVNDLFRTYKIKEDNSPPILKMVDVDPDSKRSFAIASSWLERCSKNHPCCKPPAELQKPPKRLINVGNETQSPFLVETFPDLQQVEWLSLSYCWGGEPSMKLTEDTMKILKNGVPLMNFDATIRDAILVTRALDISYIWIDALCIKQDHDEWNEEASKMNEIYGGSVVTLVIASSDSVKNGFLSKRKPNYVPIPYFKDLVEGCRAKLFLSPEWDKIERKHNKPWSSRGWTMQEGLLPNRLLYYTASQIIWECGEEQRFERGITESFGDRMIQALAYPDYDELTFDSGFLWRLPTFLKFKKFKDHLPRSVDGPLMSRASTFRLWYELVEDYTQRRFTNIGDRLIAISGLARIYGDMIQNLTYVAGLWKEDLIRGLLWYNKGAKLIPQQHIDHISTSHNALPSWSWVCAGHEGIENDLKYRNGLHAISKIESVQIDLVNPEDPFSAVKSGSITITGPFKRFPRLYNEEWKSPQVSISRLECHISSIVEQESQGRIEHKYLSPPGGHFGILLMLQERNARYILVLEATGEILNGINMYRRVGILTLFYVNPTSPVSPELLAQKEMRTSIAARLDQRGRPRTQETTNSELWEIERENWTKETVMIV